MYESAPMDENPIRSLLEKQDWGDIHARVLDFATYRVGDKTSNARAEDLTQAAIARVYAYDSKWDPAKEPDLTRFLMSVVNSLLANERTSAREQRNVSFSDPKSPTARRALRAAQRVSDPRAHSEAEHVDHDLLARRLTLLGERFAGDPQALEYLALLQSGEDSPAEIRAATGWSAETVMNVRRRVLRGAALVARDLGGASDEPDPHAPSDAHDEPEETVQ